MAGDAQGRAARFERLGLAVTSLVLLFGLWLTYVEQTTTFSTFEADLQNGALVNLSSIRDESALIPRLTMFPERAEKAVVAAAVLRRVHGATGAQPMTHVGALASVALPASQVRSDTRLVVLNSRLQARPDASQIAVFNGADIAELKDGFVVRTPDAFQRQITIAIAVFMLAFWAAHLVRWRFGAVGDPLLLPVVHLLTGLGMVAMLALRDPLRDTVAMATVAGGIGAGCALWTALAFVDFEDPRLRRAVLAPLTAAVGLAIALIMFGSGPTGSNARVNLLGFQPVEVVRLLVVFSLAAYFARRWQFLRELSADHGARRGIRRWVRLPRWKDVRPLAVSITALLALFFLQRDLGPALVLSCVFLGLYGISRARVGLVVAGFAVLTTGFAAGYALGVPSTVTRRVAIALDPWENALPGGDQIAHALWALSSGGPWGLGPGVGEPHVIPAGHTDLVMAALGEELGYIGFASIAVLFAILVWRLLRISVRAPGDYTAFLTIGLTLALAVQGLVIVAGMLGLLPLAGVVTPFLSYGRSAMLSNFAALGVCAAIARRRGPARDALTLPTRALGWSLAAAALLIVVRAADVQVVRADTFATRANLTQQADGGYRYQYNPRLTSAARSIVRGTIFDRDGLPLATSRPGEIEKFASQYKKLGLELPRTRGERPSTRRGCRRALLPAGRPGIPRARRRDAANQLGRAQHLVCRAGFRRALEGLRRSGANRRSLEPARGDDARGYPPRLFGAVAARTTQRPSGTRGRPPHSGARTQPSVDDRRRAASAHGASAARSSGACAPRARGRRRDRSGDGRSAGGSELSVAGRCPSSPANGRLRRTPCSIAHVTVFIHRGPRSSW